jgi:hypothetical protein
MKDDKTYVDEQWDDLPLPDGNTAWQRMELLLDEEEKRRRVLPFWLWRYGGLSLLLAGLLVAAWFAWLNPNAEVPAQQPPAETKAATSQPASSKPAAIHSSPAGSAASPVSRSSAGSIAEINKPAAEGPLQTSGQPQKAKPFQSSLKPKSSANSTASRRSVFKEDRTTATWPQQQTNKPTINRSDEPVAAPARDEQKIVVPKKDSLSTKQADTTKAATPVAGTQPGKKEAKRNTPLEISAGIGLQQAIALGSQGSSSFNYKGKRSSVSDLFPSVYLRLQRGKWFAQAEFQYAVPQPVEQFSFSQKTTYDAAAQNINTERLQLQKLYYHQLPFSVNYHLLPNWSVGAGTVYNILAGAVTEEEVQSRNVQSGAESITRQLAPVRGYKDSFLYKTTAGILLQTDYHWKRFSLGVRYTQNLQPFIRYTSATGEVLDEKNKVLQAILRFKLF